MAEALTLFFGGAFTASLLWLAFVYHLSNQAGFNLRLAREAGKIDGFREGYAARARISTEKLR
jgi:hypothetical protein